MHMRSKLGRVLVTLTATIAVAAAATASASAASWYTGGSPLSASASLTGPANSTVVMEMEPGVSITCYGMELKGASITAPAAGKIEHIIWKECGYSEGSLECGLAKHTIETKALNIEAALGKTSPEDVLTLSPQVKTLVMEITSTGRECPFAGTVQVTGKIKLTMPHGQSELAEQHLAVSTIGSNLQIPGDSAVILYGYGEIGEKLTTGANWSFH
jgi:hypothetical protein